MAVRTALSRRRRKIPAINNPTAGLLELGDLSNTKKLLKHWFVTFYPGAG